VTDMGRVVDRYAAVHQVSRRTGWKDLGRLIDAGLVRKVRGAAPGQAASYVLCRDLAEVPADLPKSLGRAVEKVADDPLSAAKGRPTLAVVHRGLADCVAVQYGSRSSVAPVRESGCGRVHTCLYTREGPTPPPPQLARRHPSWPSRRTPWGDQFGYDETDIARHVLTRCEALWRAQRQGQVPGGEEVPDKAELASLEHLVVLLLRYMPAGEAVEVLTTQVASARDLPGVVRYRAGRILRSMRRRHSIQVDDDGAGYRRMQERLAQARAAAGQPSAARLEASRAARLALAAAAASAVAQEGRWAKADAAAGAVRWAVEPAEASPAAPVRQGLDARETARLRAIVRARADRALKRGA
jgi:hypothetical protein